jgi:release factor glutamine methyltransferase
VADGPRLRRLLDDATQRLGDHTDARRIVEEASGWEGADLVLHLDDAANALVQRRWRSMVDRRAGGEPLQYVLGRWGFRALEVRVDRRALIPRPETEVVVEHALATIDALDARIAIDLGTGSGVIALSLASERARLDVWATDVSEDALDLARANLAGIGRAGTRVRLAAGDWFAALPPDLAGTIDVVVANPPYVGAHESLPADVADWEPPGALVAGPRGTEAIERIVHDAPMWLRARGALVLEIGETQGDEVTALAHTNGFAATVHPDFAGRPRVLVATR